MTDLVQAFLKKWWNNIVSQRSQAYDAPYNKTAVQTGVPCKLLSCCEGQVVVKAIYAQLR